MYLLAFETSCDDTSIAIFRDYELLALLTRSQISEHAETSGVVPEVAARLHANVIFGVLEDVLSQAGLSLREIDVIACTKEPGLAPSLLVGKTVARSISRLLDIPLLWVNHIEGHIFSNLLERTQDEIPFPNVCLTVSGGHNELYLWKSLFEREKLGETLDDSAGEAFDKVAKMMGLGYPGGPIISKLASEYDGDFIGIFPEVLLEKESLDFSFSGLKSAVKREVDARKKQSENLDEFGHLRLEHQRRIAFEFEQTTTNILIKKLLLAGKQCQVSALTLAGGVSANDTLQEKLIQAGRLHGYQTVAPKKKIYSQDNAAMIGICASYRSKANEQLKAGLKNNVRLTTNNTEKLKKPSCMLDCE